MLDFIVGTSDGVVQFRHGEVAGHCLTGMRVSAVHARGSGDHTRILAGTYGHGVFRSVDSGDQWTPVVNGLTAPAIRTFEDDPFHPGAILVGTEPGRIFRSDDDGLSWSGLNGIERLPWVNEWYLPYSPRAGAVRNIYSPPGSDRLLGSVEVGGLITSDDRGGHWAVNAILGDTDIHFITGHPDEPDLLFAALGWASLKSVPVPDDAPALGGIARSTDGGGTWTKFHSAYTRALIVPPTRPDLLLAAPARKVGAGGWIEVSADRGDTWQPASDGIATPMPDMVERFLPAPDGTILAICSGGGLLRAIPGEWYWTPALPDGAAFKVESVAFAVSA